MKKTETMVIAKSSFAPACEIQIGQTSFKPVDKFKYLGAILTGDGEVSKKSDDELHNLSKQSIS